MELRGRSRARQSESRESQAHRIGWFVQPVVQVRLIPVGAERCTCTHVFYRKGTINHLGGLTYTATQHLINTEGTSLYLMTTLPFTRFSDHSAIHSTCDVHTARSSTPFSLGLIPRINSQSITLGILSTFKERLIRDETMNTHTKDVQASKLYRMLK